MARESAQQRIEKASEEEIDSGQERKRDEEIRVQKRKERDFITGKYAKRDRAGRNSESGESSDVQTRLQEAIFIYDTDDVSKLILTYEGAVLHDTALSTTCGLMDCNSGCLLKLDTKIAVNNHPVLQPGKYEFVVFPRRGGGFSISPSGYGKGVPSFLSYSTWLVNDRTVPPGRLATDLYFSTSRWMRTRVIVSEIFDHTSALLGETKATTLATELQVFESWTCGAGAAAY